MPATTVDLFALLDRLGIEHSTVKHPPIFTVEEGRPWHDLIPGLHCKNLFIKDRKHDLILRGGASKMAEAECVILGGHSINDDEIKFGYSVTGTVHPERIWKNAGAQPGDVLMFTKRLGTGGIGTALKRGLAIKSTHLSRS